MTAAVILGLVALTSLGAVLLGLQRQRLAPAGLRPAATEVLEGLGWGLVFFAANLLVGGLAIAAVRAGTGRFVTIYVLNDITLPALSLLQGLLFQAWRTRGRGPGDGGPGPRATPPAR